MLGKGFAAALLMASLAAPGDPLAVTSTGLTEGQRIGNYVMIHPTWTDGADVVTIQVLVGGTLRSTWTSWRTGIEVGFPAALDDTDADVTIRVVDRAGHSAEATTRVHVDVTLPHATITPWTFAAFRGTAVITASGLSDDVAEVALMDNRLRQVISRATAAPWTLTWDTVAYPDTVSVVVTDRAGNPKTYPQSYVADNENPVISDLRHTCGPLDDRVNGRCQLVFDAPDKSGVSRVEWWIDGALAGVDQQPEYGTTTGGMIIYDFGRTDRASRIEVRVWDLAGNEATRTFDVTVDGTAPEIDWLTPAAGSLVRGTQIRSTVQVSDPGGIWGAELNGVQVSPADWDMKSTRLTGAVPTGPDGQRTLTWSASDPFDNTGTVSRVVIVDNTRPAVAITKAPANKARVRGIVRVVAAASDRNGLARVELLINGRVAVRAGTARYPFPINASRFGQTFKIQIRVYDKAGNVTTTPARTWYRR